MTGSHIHVGVKDFNGALRWAAEVWQLRPVFSNDRMAVFPLGGLSLVLDQADEDTEATIAFDSQDCDTDYQAVISRGADSIESPSDQPWGVRVAYIQGPGKLVFEIEQALKPH